ncbi:MAG: hypothetical protein AB7G28_06100 [Pirellulales bacterium]
MLIAFVLVCACLSYLVYHRWTAIRYRRRFSLFDLLVVVTLFAAAGGLVYGLRTDKSLRRHMWFHDFYEEWREDQSEQN